jgi:hypothetical protein
MQGETPKPILAHPRCAHHGRARKFLSVRFNLFGCCARFAAVCWLGLVLFSPGSAGAQLLTGSIVNYPDSEPFNIFSFGDGTHSVHLSWSVNIPSRSGFFYRNYYTEVALAAGVSSINQITNAAAFTFTTELSYYICACFKKTGTS